MNIRKIAVTAVLAASFAAAALTFAGCEKSNEDKIKALGKDTKEVAKDTGSGIKEGFKEVGKGFKKGWEKVKD